MESGINKLKEIWQRKPLRIDPKDAPELNKKAIYDAMGHIFCPGPFYFYVFDLSKVEFIYIHHSIEKVLGYKPEEISMEMLAGIIPPEDLLHIQKCEQRASVFFLDQLDPSRIMRYKVSYSYRLKAKSGREILILHQAIPLTLDLNNRILTSLGVHSNISHLADHNNGKISFIGLGDEPSFLGVDVDKGPRELIGFEKPLLTKRETEVLQYLAEGNTVEEISEKLNRSIHTVRTHRNKIREKLQCKNTPQVIAKAVREGLI